MPSQLAIEDAIHLLQTFRGADLTQTIYQIEKSLKAVSAESYSTVPNTSGAKAEVLGAAGRSSNWPDKSMWSFTR